MPVALKYHLDLEPQSKWNMISATAAAKSSLIFAQEIGDFFAGPDYFTTREGFASYLIKLTIDGCGVLEYNGQKHQIPPGRFFWIDCGRHQHYYTAPAVGNWHVMWVHFYGANAQAYYDAFMSYNNGSPTAALPLNSKAYGVFQELLALEPAGANQMMTDFQASNLLTQLAAECVLAAMAVNEARNVPEIIRSVGLFLAEHYREKHTLESLGARFNINPFYLQKQFKRYMGLSPTEYHTFHRMTQAKALMRSTHKSIGEIACEVGVENMGYFSRLFKRQEGMTPQAYRKLWPVLEQGFGQEFPPQPSPEP